MTNQEIRDVLVSRGWKQGRYKNGKLVEKTNNYYTSPTRPNFSLYITDNKQRIYVCLSTPTFDYVCIEIINSQVQKFEIDNNLLYMTQHGIRTIAIDIS